MRKKKPSEPMEVRSYRIPHDIYDFLKAQAKEQDRPMSYILINILRLYMNYLTEQAKQPRVAK